MGHLHRPHKNTTPKRKPTNAPVLRLFFNQFFLLPIDFFFCCFLLSRPNGGGVLLHVCVCACPSTPRLASDTFIHPPPWGHPQKRTYVLPPPANSYCLLWCVCFRPSLGSAPTLQILPPEAARATQKRESGNDPSLSHSCLLLAVCLPCPACTVSPLELHVCGFLFWLVGRVDGDECMRTYKEFTPHPPPTPNHAISAPPLSSSAVPCTS